MIDLKEVFEKYRNDFLRFELVEEKLHSRPDVCAFILLDKLLPEDGCDMVSAAEHDIIYLDVDCDKLAGIATEEDVLMLVRCGVLFNGEYDSLYMFV